MSKDCIPAWRKRYDLKKSKGLCVQCGRKVSDGKTMCLACRKRAKLVQHEEREYLKSMGICVRCRKNRAETGKTQCKECLRYKANRYYAVKEANAV